MTIQHFAVIGWPVRHSVSPIMQNAAFMACGIPARYDALEVPPEKLQETFLSLRQQEYRGWNITVPHKQAALPLLDTVDSGARLCGSVNTVCHDQGRLNGFSTDGYGLVKALDETFGLNVCGARILLAGCGGAGRAVALELVQRGAQRMILLNRTLERAMELAALLRSINPTCRIDTDVLVNRSRLEGFAKASDVLIQATSLGLHPDDPLPFPPELLPPGLAVMDMIYRPTPFLRKAAARGCRTTDGRAMLLHQGARSFTLWTGLPAPVEIMRTALSQALKQTPE